MAWLIALILNLGSIAQYLSIAINIAMAIWNALPFFHKIPALFELRDAVAKSKASTNPQPILEWTDRWKRFTAPIPDSADLKKE